jgi:hypothetical protein
VGGAAQRDRAGHLPRPERAHLVQPLRDSLGNTRVWSPSGTQILLTHFVGRKSEIVVIIAAGSGQTTLPLPGTHSDNRPDWGKLPTP